MKDFNIFVLKFSSLLSLLVGLVPFGWLVVEGGGIENDLVVLVVVGIEVVGAVCSTADGRSLIHTAPETKWYPDGQAPPGSGDSTIGTLVVVVMRLLLPLPVLLVCCGNCDNSAVDGEYDCCAYT